MYFWISNIMFRNVNDFLLEIFLGNIWSFPHGYHNCFQFLLVFDWFIYPCVTFHHHCLFPKQFIFIFMERNNFIFLASFIHYLIVFFLKNITVNIFWQLFKTRSNIFCNHMNIIIFDNKVLLLVWYNQQIFTLLFSFVA